jgi:DNA-binding NtrC family response regulator
MNLYQADHSERRRFTQPPTSNPPGALKAQPSKSPQEPSLAKGKVLLVEDDESSMSALAEILRLWGWGVETAATATEALQRVDGKAAVILDLMLPDGDGTAVMEYIQQMGMSTLVVVTTGANDTVLMAQVARLRPVKVLTKPIDLGQLQRCLDRA